MIDTNQVHLLFLEQELNLLLDYYDKLRLFVENYNYHD
jgi:hypothetical protein